jgi:hypothetical protein
MISKIRMSSWLFRSNPFQNVPLIEDYLVLPNVDCVFLRSSTSTSILAAQLRDLFPNLPFVLTPIDEADGLLPEAAWNFIKLSRNSLG